MTRGRILCAAAALAFSIAAAAPSSTGARSVTIVHFSDYHAHALPFPLEGEPRAAGIARAIAALKRYARDPRTIVLSGGDMVNFGSPAWSDKYGCVEWPWLNGIVSAMAYGNHDSDYGPDALRRCRESVSFPVLSANTLDAEGRPVFLHDGKPYVVIERNGVRVGVFALAGPDFEKLVAKDRRPVPGARFADGPAAAREVVAALRGQEAVDAVVMIGHEYHEDDVALARAVPGIDVIFGTHSHRKEPLVRIPGTGTWTLSPYQYLSYLSRVDLEVKGGRVTAVRGGLLKMNGSLPEDPTVAAEVARLREGLVKDPAYAPLFEVIGAARKELSIDGRLERDAPFCDLVLDVVREAAGADVALLTASSFREPIPPGEIREETLRAAMPYVNKVLLYTLRGSKLQELLDASAARRGSDAFCQVSGVRFAAGYGKAVRVQLVRKHGLEPLEAAAVYKVALSDFQALVAPGYSTLLAGTPHDDTGLEMRELVRRHLKSRRPTYAARDGRIGLGASGS